MYLVCGKQLSGDISFVLTAMALIERNYDYLKVFKISFLLTP
jgi:hypothetical protein